MATKEEGELIRAGFTLSQAAPGEWNEFLVKLGAYCDLLMRMTVDAAPDKLVNHQGQAQQANRLHKLFAEARISFDAVRKSNAKHENEKWLSM